MANNVNNEMQEKMLVYQVLEQRINSLVQQRELLTSELVEIENTLSSIDEIRESKETVLFPIGSSAYVRGNIEDNDKIIVNVGANVAMEKDIEGGKSILSDRKNEIKDAIESIQTDIENASNMMYRIETEIKQMSSLNQNKFDVVSD